jgi:hypothetical protein
VWPAGEAVVDVVAVERPPVVPGRVPERRHQHRKTDGERVDAIAVEEVDLDALDVLALVFPVGGRERRWAEPDPGETESVQRVGPLVAVDPGRAD